MDSTEQQQPISPDDQQLLLDLARESILFGLRQGQPLELDKSQFDDRLQQLQASFVTLHRNGRLRGCIGALEPRWPLVEDVVRHAYGAAFQDPRFAPLAEDEYPELHLHISVLSPRIPIQFENKADLLRQLQPGNDGLVINDGPHSATFLPSVWESLPDPEEFLAQLKRKAGMHNEPTQAWRYSAQNISEPE